jgi:cytochrome c oxidase cbb3-type subunit 1
MPLHMNFQLYGWIALPLVGLLLRAFAVEDDRGAGTALMMWSGALVLGACFWLAGVTSGKLFLDWAHLPRWAYLLALAFLWLVLARGGWRHRHRFQGWQGALRWALLGALALVPAAMFFATNTAVYPSVNPDSGGATGASLLGSSLGMVLLFLAVPPLLQGRPRGGTKRLLPTFLIMGLHLLLFAVLDHGDTSNHDPTQILGLASLLIWVPLTIRYYRMFSWPAHTRPWLIACAGWGSLLVIDGCLSFLPGLLLRWKFTNAMVAHAHLAMAGLVTSFLMLVLLSILPSNTSLSRPLPAVLWQVACLLKVLVLMIAATYEAGSTMYTLTGPVQTLYLLRFAAGVVMWLISLVWWTGTLRSGEQIIAREVLCPA